MRAAVCAILLTSTAALSAEPIVRARLFSSRTIQQCTISSRGRMNLADESGSVRAKVAPDHEVTISADAHGLVAQRGGQRFTSRLIRISSENGLISAMGRPYRGEISLRWLDGNIIIVNSLPLEDYLRAVVPCEMPTTFHPEALKAQAVVSRAIALRWLGKHAAEGADFCDLTHCQVYQGASSESARTDDAVAGTRGLVLTYAGEPASPVYHSTCGGHTADAGAVWPGRTFHPYLKGSPDILDGQPACAKSPHFRWQATVSRDELDSALGVRDAKLQVAETDASGRAAAVEVRFSDGRKRLTGVEFHLLLGRKLGWARVKSARFTVRRVSEGWLFEGRGIGHGVGMCQWGANARAHAGHAMPQILSHYFPATQVSTRRTSVSRQ